MSTFHYRLNAWVSSNSVCLRCFLQRWYWCGQTTNVVSVDDYTTDDSPDYGDRAEFFEPTASDRNVGIKIRNLTKVFTSWLFTRRTSYGLTIYLNLQSGFILL